MIVIGASKNNYYTAHREFHFSVNHNSNSLGQALSNSNQEDKSIWKILAMDN